MEAKVSCGIRRSGCAVALALLLSTVVSPSGANLFERPDPGPPEQRGALRVCADPNNMPFSKEGGLGFENRIAELMAEELGVPLEYTWYPQRFGYIRATLRRWLDDERRYRCDVLMGVPQNARGFSTTTPYYRATHMLVYVKGRGLDDLECPKGLLELEPERREKLVIGAFDRSPAALWLTSQGMARNFKGYVQASGDLSEYAGRMIERDLVKGVIDIAAIWGPIAGYYAARSDVEMKLLPMECVPGADQIYAISIGVRAGDHELLRPLQVALRKHQETIDALLKEYNIPVIEDPRRQRSQQR